MPRSLKIRIDPSDSPDRVNDLLSKKWGISIFKFAQVFAVSPIDRYLEKRNIPFDYQTIKDIRDELSKMYGDILKRARRIDALMDRSEVQAKKKLSDLELGNEKEIRDFYINYIYPRLLLTTFFERSSQLGKRGGGLNRKSIVAAGWGNIIAKRGKRIDWTLLGDLYLWFWERVCQYDGYAKWNPPEGIEEYLKCQYHEHRFRGDLDQTALQIIPSEDILEKQDFGFLRRLLLLKWTDGKIPEKDLPNFILNFLLDWLVTASEGLTIFTPRGSIADPKFGYLYFWLKSGANKEITLPIEFPESAKKMLSKQELPFQGTVLGNYFFHAAELFRKRDSELTKLEPMIIFPDRTHYPLF